MTSQIKKVDDKNKIIEDEEKILYSIMKEELLLLVNNVREEKGLSILSNNKELDKIAQIHSNGQFKCKKMSHSGCPSYPGDKETLRERVDSTDYNWRRIGENVAYGYRNSKNVFDAWMRSPGHRENILNPNFQDIGIGIKGQFLNDIYWTQVFGESFDK